MSDDASQCDDVIERLNRCERMGVDGADYVGVPPELAERAAALLTKMRDELAEAHEVARKRLKEKAEEVGEAQAEIAKLRSFETAFRDEVKRNDALRERAEQAEQQAQTNKETVERVCQTNAELNTDLRRLRAVIAQAEDSLSGVAEEGWK